MPSVRLLMNSGAVIPRASGAGSSAAPHLILALCAVLRLGKSPKE